MTDVASLAVEDGIGILTIDSPPVNALGAKVRRALQQGISRLADDEAVKAIVLICGGRTFFAGADISEFGKPPERPYLREAQDTIESVPKPVIAAIHGTALGGGYEVALVCHYRIAASTAKVGLPEVNLGLLPGAGGTQRLPRIVGIETALDLLTSGRPVGAAQALELGMIDAVAAEGRLREDAVAFAKRMLDERRPLRRVRDRQEKVEPWRNKPEVFDAFRKKNARSFRGFKAPENIVKAVQAAADLPFEGGMQRELELFGELINSVESRAQRYVFFAERESSKIPDVPATTATLPVKSVGVIGAGTMGGGIAMNFVNAGIPVVLVETRQEALEKGLQVIRRNYENTVKKGRLTAAQMEQCLSLIKPSLALEAVANVDLVIEAVYEELQLKREIFGKLDGVCKPGAILASNTSFLDLNEISSATRRPEWVVGLHFFSPANVMRLLEVVRGEKTSNEVIATAMKLAKHIGKVPVLSRVCYGFIANRIMTPRGVQASGLVLEGPSPQDIDAAMVDYGFAMGPFQMIDLVGLDVLGRGSTERSVVGDLVKLGHLGQKQNGGYYDYDENRKATPSPVAAQVIAEFARFQEVENLGPQTRDEIVARLLYPVVNEGAKVLEEQIAIRASDVDVAAILGYNWPVYTGGPMFWADTVGLPKILAKLKEFEARYGAAFKPARLLETLVLEGKSFTRS